MFVTRGFKPLESSTISHFFPHPPGGRTPRTTTIASVIRLGERRKGPEVLWNIERLINRNQASRRPSSPRFMLIGPLTSPFIRQ